MEEPAVQEAEFGYCTTPLVFLFCLDQFSSLDVKYKLDCELHFNALLATENDFRGRHLALIKRFLG